MIMASILIGNYFIRTFDFIHPPSKPENIWIQHDDGEGIEIPIEKFNEYIKQFFKENM